MWDRVAKIQVIPMLLLSLRWHPTFSLAKAGTWTSPAHTDTMIDEFVPQRSRSSICCYVHKLTPNPRVTPSDDWHNAFYAFGGCYCGLLRIMCMCVHRCNAHWRQEGEVGLLCGQGQRRFFIDAGKTKIVPIAPSVRLNGFRAWRAKRVAPSDDLHVEF